MFEKKAEMASSLTPAEQGDVIATAQMTATLEEPKSNNPEHQAASNTPLQSDYKGNVPGQTAVTLKTARSAEFAEEYFRDEAAKQNLRQELDPNNSLAKNNPRNRDFETHIRNDLLAGLKNLQADIARLSTSGETPKITGGNRVMLSPIKLEYAVPEKFTRSEDGKVNLAENVGTAITALSALGSAMAALYQPVINIFTASSATSLAFETARFLMSLPPAAGLGLIMAIVSFLPASLAIYLVDSGARFLERTVAKLGHPAHDSKLLNHIRQTLASEGVECEIELTVSQDPQYFKTRYRDGHRKDGGIWQVTIKPFITLNKDRGVLTSKQVNSSEAKDSSEKQQPQTRGVSALLANALDWFGISPKSWNIAARAKQAAASSIENHRARMEALGLPADAKQDRINFELAIRKADIASQVLAKRGEGSLEIKVMPTGQTQDLASASVLSAVTACGSILAWNFAYPSYLQIITAGGAVSEALLTAGSGAFAGFLVGGIAGFAGLITAQAALRLCAPKFYDALLGTASSLVNRVINYKHPGLGSPAMKAVEDQLNEAGYPCDICTGVKDGYYTVSVRPRS